MKAQIKRLSGEIVIGEQVQTRGDDDNFPTFILEDGTRLGTHRDNIVEWIED